MKRFLLRSTWFLLPLLVAGILFECHLRNLPNSYRAKDAWMCRHASEVETLVLGDSHAFYGIRADLLDGSAFNLANISQRPDYNRFLLEFWGDRMERLRTVVLPIAYFTLPDPRFEDCEEWFMARYYRLYMHCSFHWWVSKYGLEMSDPKTAWQKFAAARQGEQLHACDTAGNGTDYVLALRDPHWNDESVCAATARRHTRTDHAAQDYNMGELRAIADSCRRRRWRLVLVTTPCWPDYVARLDAQQLQLMYESVEMLERDYGAVYLDFLTDSRFTADDFFDCDHLSEMGAEKFTRLLNEALNQRVAVSAEE